MLGKNKERYEYLAKKNNELEKKVAELLGRVSALEQFVNDKFEEKVGKRGTGFEKDRLTLGPEHDFNGIFRG